MKSVVHQVSKLGFSAGAHVVSKGADFVQVFEVILITEESAMLLERGLVLACAPKSLTINLPELTENWKPFKGKITGPLKGWSSHEVASPNCTSGVLLGCAQRHDLPGNDEDLSREHECAAALDVDAVPEHGDLQHSL